MTGRGIRPALLEGVAKIECIENSSCQKGMFTSVKLGLSRRRADRCFVLPADIPLVPLRVYQRLLTLDPDIIVPPRTAVVKSHLQVLSAIVPRLKK
jgi:CTP:molybdopterin cytidylyltransferase MocA